MQYDQRTWAFHKPTSCIIHQLKPHWQIAIASLRSMNCMMFDCHFLNTNLYVPNHGLNRRETTHFTNCWLWWESWIRILLENLDRDLEIFMTTTTKVEFRCLCIRNNQEFGSFKFVFIISVEILHNGLFYWGKLRLISVTKR